MSKRKGDFKMNNVVDKKDVTVIYVKPTTSDDIKKLVLIKNMVK